MPDLKANRSAKGLLKILLAATVVVPPALLAATAFYDYQAAFAECRRELAHQSEVAREQAAKVFDSEVQVADRVNDLLARRDADAVRAGERDYHDAFAAVIARLPQVQSVMVADTSGHPLASAGTYPVPQDVNVRDRDYFRGVLSNSGAVYIGALQIGDINRQWFFGLSRAWTGSNGAFKGVIDVAVAPTFFSDFYSLLVNEAGGEPEGRIITLIREDGAFLTRYPPLPPSQAKVPLSSPMFVAIREIGPDGIYEAPSQVDSGGPRRIFVYHKVQGYPVYVVAGRSRASVLAAWHRAVLSRLRFGVPATLALFAVTWTALVRAQKEEAALIRAREEIARRERAEAALLRAQRLEAVGQMTGGVAHDFNNLLTVILGSAETLAKRADDPVRVRRLAEQIALAARHGGQVTQQLLTFSRRQFVHPELVDVNRLVRDFKPLLDQAAGEAVRIALALDAAVGAVRLDPGHFEAAILNLVGNARDAMPEGGRIVIATEPLTLPEQPEQPDLPGGDYVRVAVSDSGAGMDAQTAAKAFEPFFTTKEIGRGTGLGLSQVYGFVKQANGDVRIISTPGHGTTVEMLLPRADAPRPDGEAAVSVMTGAKDGEVVLVVEDQPEVLATVVDLLDSLGYGTVTAPSAAAALDLLRERRRLDLLFSDVVMPGGLDGPALAAEARRLQRGIKVLLTSGYPADAMGEVPVLLKPYDRAGLATQLRAVLDS